MQSHQSDKFDYAFAMSVTRSFNVAAICALAIWHGYTFYLNQAIARSPKPMIIEFKYQGEAHGVNTKSLNSQT